MITVAGIKKGEDDTGEGVLAEVTFLSDQREFSVSVRENEDRRKRYGMPSNDLPVDIRFSDSVFDELVGVNEFHPDYDAIVERIELELGDALAPELVRIYGLAEGTRVTTFVSNIDDRAVFA